MTARKSTKKKAAGTKKSRKKQNTTKKKDSTGPSLPTSVDLSHLFEDSMEPLSPLSQAQDLIFDAYESPTAEKAVKLARKALSISPDCADAYYLLAEKATASPDEELELLQEAVRAGERALGPETFKEDAGHFWGLVETRPYMRARAGLAQALYGFGNRREACDHLHELLRLNPNDNQGQRFLLLSWLIELGEIDEAQELFHYYPDGFDVFWSYGDVLLTFIQQGDAAPTREALKFAIAFNPHVPDFLLMRKPPPLFERPETYALHSPEEAIIYSIDNRTTWQSCEGALLWLAGQTRDLDPPDRSQHLQD